MTTPFHERRLGNGGPVVGPMGVGTWAMGGPFYAGPGWVLPEGTALGYGQTDDAESIRAIHCAMDCGASLFDTSDAYGTGQGEEVLGEAIKGRRDEVVIATKFGNVHDRATRQLTGADVSPGYIRQACESSLRRLQTEWIDLYQLHLGDLPVEQADGVANTLDALCAEGKIRSYGWSTDDPDRARKFGNRKNASAVQFQLNVLNDAPDMLEVCTDCEFAGLNRGPLAMGLLSGKYSQDSQLAADDIRCNPPEWLVYFDTGGKAAASLENSLEAIREVLTSKGRTQAQGALAWIWARSNRTIPIPGIRTVAQAKENLGAMDFGPLLPEQMKEIEGLLGRRE